MSEAERMNPEVMGRTEPRPVEQPQRIDAPPAPGRMELWPEMTEYRRRFDALQSEFIDEPRAAVKKAERLMEEAVDRMAKAMHERMQRIHRDVDGNADTELLRQAMRSYREMIDSIGGRRAA
ncbi:MAG: hypothetical protein E6J20_16615 [Chloroflexi bacterium]|nr:MAG: hypothetical protein E6J20_16615 [Chloroflexota bacterium]